MVQFGAFLDAVTSRCTQRHFSIGGSTLITDFLILTATSMPDSLRLQVANRLQDLILIMAETASPDAIAVDLASRTQHSLILHFAACSRSR